jgi:dipeptidyl-peptidase-4
MNIMRNMCSWVGLPLIALLVACQNNSINNNTVNIISDNDSPLNLKRIYQENEFASERMDSFRWLADSSGYTATEQSSVTFVNDQGDSVSIGEDIVVYDPNTLQRKTVVNALQLMPKNSQKALSIDDYIWSTDRQKLLIYTNSKKVWRSNSRGDYWLFDLAQKTLIQLGGKKVKPSSLMFAKFSPNGQHIAYVVDNNIYLETLATQQLTALTDDGVNGIINGVFDWVYEEEFTIKDGFRWSPDSKKIAYWQLDTTGSKDFLMINNTDALYPTVSRFPYPKVGEVNALAKVAIINIASTHTVWTQLPNNSRDMYIPRMNWSGNSHQILIQHVNRKQDTNHLYLANAKDGVVNKIMVEKEQQFLDFFDDARWLDNGKSFIWTSERSGWRHLYRISRDAKQIINLTNGNFDITSIQALDEKNGWIYYIAAADNVAQRYLFRSKLDGSLSHQRITPATFTGVNHYQMSANGQWAIHSHSRFDQPTQKRLIQVDNHQQRQLLMDNKSLIQKLAKLSQPSHEFFQVNAQDGLVLDGYLIRPADFDPTKKYPIIFYVYGESWGQTVQDRWRGNAYLWDKMLTEQGYIIASIDNRGTRAPKGRAWRKSIYGAVGVLSSRDQSDALLAMAKRWEFIDTDRVGIWGHSGGGSMTLNMLFRYPEQYHVGISQAPVADQRLYDTIYQERYSGLLADHANGYKIGSPITFAKNLKGKLLLIHGTGDDNVHYQGTERLINELIKHNRQFEFMSYPNRSHSLAEGEGTTLHLQTLKTNYFNQHLMTK